MPHALESENGAHSTGRSWPISTILLIFVIFTFEVEDIKTLIVEDSPLNNLDTFKITIEDGYRGDWRKYSFGDSISKNSSFDQSLLTFSISDDNDGSLMKIIYDGTELEDYEDVTDARGKSTMLDLEYIDKNGNSKSFDPDMDTKELVELIKWPKQSGANFSFTNCCNHVKEGRG